MMNGSRRSELWREALTYAAAALACALLLLVVLQLWDADLRVPFGYIAGEGIAGGDAFWVYMLAKSLVDSGWVQPNAHPGLPFGMDLLDFPITEKLHLVIMKLLAAITGDFALTVNLYYLGGFVLTALTMVAAARETG